MLLGGPGNQNVDRGGGGDHITPGGVQGGVIEIIPSVKNKAPWSTWKMLACSHNSSSVPKLGTQQPSSSKSLAVATAFRSLSCTNVDSTISAQSSVQLWLVSVFAVCMRICVYVYMCICVYVYMCICVYVYMCICVNVYMC